MVHWELKDKPCCVKSLLTRTVVPTPYDIHSLDKLLLEWDFFSSEQKNGISDMLFSYKSDKETWCSDDTYFFSPPQTFVPGSGSVHHSSEVYVSTILSVKLYPTFLF